MLKIIFDTFRVKLANTVFKFSMFKFSLALAGPREFTLHIYITEQTSNKSQANYALIVFSQHAVTQLIIILKFQIHTYTFPT